jgi:CDP-glycerol glycerophosphotransferase (TagB/SpsB family)
MPTHRREYGDRTWLPPLNAAMVEEAFGGTPLKLVVKTHPNAEWEVFRELLPDHPQVRLLTEMDVDANTLLHLADALISDYSSAVFDYAILRRPIYFLAPDIDRYDARRGLYDPYDTLTGGRQHGDWPSLLALIRAELASGSGAPEGLANVNRVADYCANNEQPDACARIAAHIISRTTRSSARA